MPCEFAVPEPPPGQQIDPNRVNLVFVPKTEEPLLVLRSSTADCDEGWYFSADSKTVVLCEKTCDRAQADADSSLELFFGCTADEVLIR
jgi:hypothetical protein